MKFKLLIAAAITVTALWFAWWWVAAGAQKQAIEDWMAARRADGWQADAASVEVTGAPNRLDTVLSAPALADPRAGWAWSAPRLDIYQLVYDPSKVIVEWPAEQRIAVPGARAVLRTEQMRASAAFEDRHTLALARASVDIRQAGLDADAGWTASAERYLQHLRHAAPGTAPENSYEFRIEATRVRPPAFITAIADPAGALPRHIGEIVIDGRAALDRPLDRAAFEGAAKPQLVALSLKQARATWGRLSLSLNGTLRADAEGYARGALDVTAENWEEIVDAAVTAGTISDGLADALRAGLGLVARIAGEPGALNVTVTFEDGYASIGPVPVGPAPRMRP